MSTPLSHLMDGGSYLDEGHTAKAACAELCSVATQSPLAQFDDFGSTGYSKNVTAKDLRSRKLAIHDSVFHLCLADFVRR